jgi:hypothetical protein
MRALPLACLVLTASLGLSPIHAQQPQHEMTNADGAIAAVIAEMRARYAKGHDPLPSIPLNTPIDANLAFTPVTPLNAFTPDSFMDDQGDIYRIAGVVGCMSATPVTVSAYKISQTPCMELTLTGINYAMNEVMQSARNGAIGCQIYTQETAAMPIRYADCFGQRDGATISIARIMVEGGFAWAIRDASGRPLIPDLDRAENNARVNRLGVWGVPQIPHPYGDTFKANPLAR